LPLSPLSFHTSVLTKRQILSCKMKPIKIVLVAASVFASLSISYYVALEIVDYTLQFFKSPFAMEVEISKRQMDQMFTTTWIHSFVYISFLLTFPFFIRQILDYFKIKDVFKLILIFEAIVAVYVYLFSPPDIISTLLLIVAWQPVIIINALIARTRIKKKPKQQSFE
jgi:hypothetical protein